jgi:hypothetical protein
MWNETADSSPRQQTRHWPAVLGVCLAALTITVGELLPPTLAADLHAMILVFITAVYVGFASVDGDGRALLVEIGGVALFCSLAVSGLWVWSPLWIVGYVGHAVWDTLHHPNGAFGADIVGWYLPLCVVYDLLIAGYLAVVLVAV